MVKRTGRVSRPQKVLGGRKMNRVVAKGAKPDVGGLMKINVKTAISSKVR